MTNPRDELAELWRMLRLMRDEAAETRNIAYDLERAARLARERVAELDLMQEHGWEVLRGLDRKGDVSPCAKAQTQHVLNYARERYAGRLALADDDRR